MADEVVHEHHTEGGGNNMMGIVLGIILVIALLFLVFWFVGNPFAGGNGSPTTIENTVEEGTPDGGTNVDIPDEVDVNVNDGTQ